MSITIQAEVQSALDNGDALVALESTIITHGMPWPENLETALSVEKLVRKHGAIPATIAVLDGEVHVGLDKNMLEKLARLDSVYKLSRADLAMAVSARLNGSTTVAATMLIAHRAGIPVFATGGIGGVHQGWQSTMDVSADLPELARTPVIVICAGPKAILDIPATLEYLETHGVPVVTYQADQIPAFWSRDSGINSPLNCQTIEELHQFYQAHQLLNGESGLLVANPVPIENEIERTSIQAVIQIAQENANAQGITGKAVTPFLLQRIYELTNGRSLACNQALIRNNAKLAAMLATAIMN